MQSRDEWVQHYAPTLGLPEGLDHRAWRRSIQQQLDDMFDRQMELLAILDQLDGDPDLEDCGDEMDAAYPEGRPHLMTGALEDDEDDDAAEDDGSAEPSLGAPEPTIPYCAAFGFLQVVPNWMTRDEFDRQRLLFRNVVAVPSTSQVQWSQGSRKELEEEHDGAEPDVDDEPSLGWTPREASFGDWSRGITDGESAFGGMPLRLSNGAVLDELEWDPAEHGIADIEALNDWYSYHSSVHAGDFDGSGRAKATALLLTIVGHSAG